MKKALNALMVVAILVMVFLCYKSILKPVEFDKAKDFRKEVVKKKLIDVRKAEEAYYEQHGEYCGSWDTLISFVKEGEMPAVASKGTLTDQQLEKGLTERKAWDMVYNNDGKDAAKYGIENFEQFCQDFRRDTIKEKVMEVKFKGYNPAYLDTLKYIPFTNGKEVIILKKNAVHNEKANTDIPVFSASVPNDIYLNGLDRQEIINMNNLAFDLKKYPGMRVGEDTVVNNNAGNWE